MFSGFYTDCWDWALTAGWDWSFADAWDYCFAGDWDLGSKKDCWDYFWGAVCERGACESGACIWLNTTLSCWEDRRIIFCSMIGDGLTIDDVAVILSWSFSGDFEADFFGGSSYFLSSSKSSKSKSPFSTANGKAWTLTSKSLRTLKNYFSKSDLSMSFSLCWMISSPSSTIARNYSKV